MTGNSPSGGGRPSSRKPGSPGRAAAALEEQRRELERLRAALERERARGRAERRRFAAQARQLREAAERDRQRLEEQLRSRWEAQGRRERRQLQELMLREREAEIRRLLRWKEAERRQLQRLLHRERDCVVRQARELQRQLAEELLGRGYGGRTGAPDAAAEQCRCRLQDVLAQLRWDQDGEQASRIRHLQDVLDVERRLFLEYILEHFQWHRLPPDAQPLPAAHPPEVADGNPGPATAAPPRSLSSGACLRSRALDSVSAARPGLPDGPESTRPGLLESLTPTRPLSLDSALGGLLTPEARERQASASPIASIPGSPRNAPPPPCRLPPSHPGGEDDNDSGSQSRDTVTPAPKEQADRHPAQPNSEPAEASQVPGRRCSSLRAHLPDDAAEKVERLKGKRAELTGLARRLEDRARQLDETNLRALSAPALGAGQPLCQVLGSQRAPDWREQASALLAKDRQIEELQRECHLLQVRIASGRGDNPRADGAAVQAQWLNIQDLDRLHRESQREVLRLQKQLTLQRGASRARVGEDVASPEAERSQIAALERELGARRRECADLSAQAAAERQRGDLAEAQLRAALHKGAWLARENARLQTQDDWMRQAAAENRDVRGQLERACQERDASDLLAQQLLQQATRDRERRQQLQRDLQAALRELQATREEMQAWQLQPSRQLGESGETPAGTTSGSAASGSSKDRRKEDAENASQMGNPAPLVPKPTRDPASPPPGSRPPAQNISSLSASSSEGESVRTGVLSSLSVDWASEEDNLEPDESSALGTERLEAPDAPEFKIFLARYSYDPLEGPNQHPESELPLMAGDYIYILGDMDEDGFYEGELEDGRRGLVPSILVEQIPDGAVLGDLPAEAPCRPAGQGKAWKEDADHGLFSGHPGQLMRAGPPTEVATEFLDAKTAADHLGVVWEWEKQGLGVPGTFGLGPTQLHLQSLAATSAEVTWVCSSSGHPHTVYLNGQEHSLTPAGVNRCTLHHLQPGARYQVQVKVWQPWDWPRGPQEPLSTAITFTTPLAGPPDPPLDVLVEPHASPDLLVVSWLPVTINAVGSSNGVRVTGYAVYADGLKVAEVADATAGSLLLQRSQLQGALLCQKVSVRTMSLWGESLDSVPSLVPQDGATQALEPSPFTYSSGARSAGRGPASVCSQRQARATTTSPQPQDRCREAFLEPPGMHPPRPTLDSGEKAPCNGSRPQTPGTTEAQEASKGARAWHWGPQNHRSAWPSSPPGGDEGPSGLSASSTDAAADIKRPSAGGGPCRESPQDQAAPEKVLRPRVAVPLPDPPLHTSPACDIWREWQEESVPVGLRGAERQKLRKRLGTRTLGCRKRQPGRPGPAPRAAPSRNAPRGCPGPMPLLDPAASVSVALIDPGITVTSGVPQAERKAEDFQKGPLWGAWGSQEPPGCFCSECSGHFKAEREESQAWLAGQWRPPASGQLPSVTPLDEFELPCSEGSFIPPGDPRRAPLWTPKSMMAALDYDPKDDPTRGQWKGKLSLRAGDTVTVYGPVDDDGFYYGESGSRKGLVPAYLLDHVCRHRE